jgi:triosephosphate isomerase
MKKIIVANWKMHPRTEKEAVALARASDATSVVICPPFPFIPAVARVLKRAALGAQNAFPGTTGAKTGEVSAGELKSAGVRYVILGHSERRAEGERDAQIAKKITGATAEGLIPILCVGEPASVRAKGFTAAQAYVKKQLLADLSGLAQSSKLKAQNLLIAYEPVWAISTTKNHKDETPEDAARMAQFIKKLLVVSHKSKATVLYGGSVNAKNATSFLARPEFSGALVGGASLNPAEFKKVIKAGASL